MKWVSIVILFSHVLMCFLFIEFTNGLLYIDPYGDLFYVNDLNSSGSEDNSFAFFTGVSSLFIGLLSLFFKPSRLSFLALSISALILLLVSVVLIQVGSICQTVWYGRNFLLALVVLAPPLLVIINVFFRPIEKEFRKNL